MTPKQKAKDLVDRFYQITPNETWINEPLGEFMETYTAWGQAKQCALIAVKEIKEAIDWHEYEYPNETFDHWEQVEQEIQNL